MLLLLFALLASATSAAKTGFLKSQPANAGVMPEVFLRPQIVGGDNISSITLLPWQVYVNAGGTCGGAIIDDDWVITAAHCVCTDKTADVAKEVSVMFGSTIIDGFHPTKLTMSVAKANIFVHEEYDPKSPVKKDIALIKLNVPLPLSTSNKAMVAIKLPKSSDAKKSRSFDNEPIILSGWGKTNDTQTTSNTLKYLNTTVLATSDCKVTNPEIGPEHICAKAEVGGLSSCQGDSGGPMAFKDKDKKYYLLGVTSYGGKCSDGSPGIYVRTSFFLEWISKKTGLKF